MFSKYLFHINWNVSFWKKKCSGFDFMYYMWFWKEVSFWTPLKLIKDLTFPKSLILRIKLPYNALNTRSFMLKRIHNLLKENTFHFLPLYVTRSNCKYLIHNKERFLFLREHLHSLCKKFIDVSWCCKRWMNNRLNVKHRKQYLLQTPPTWTSQILLFQHPGFKAECRSSESLSIWPRAVTPSVFPPSLHQITIALPVFTPFEGLEVQGETAVPVTICW